MTDEELACLSKLPPHVLAKIEGAIAERDAARATIATLTADLRRVELELDAARGEVEAVVVAFDTLPGPSGGYRDAEWMTVTLRAPLGCGHHFPMGATMRCMLVTS